MPTVTYDGQSFLIDGRRVWILGAAMEYARIPRELWPQRIAAARQAGFNTIQTSCPWLVHEPRPGRFRFDGDADIRTFAQLCASAGLRVIIKAGPFVGEGYDGGGLPAWLLDIPGVIVRERNEPFLERVSHYYRKLLAELSDLQATNGGPIILVQCEHAWLCANEDHAQAYLGELARALRENGVSVPITNANDLWSSDGRTIDTWRGSGDLLANLRQLRTIQPNAPRLVSTLQVAQHATWGQRPDGASPASSAGSTSGPDAVIALAQALAAGGQAVVWPFHGGTNFAFNGGRLPGDAARFACTSAAGAVLGEAGERGERYHAIRPLVSFASSFAHVLAELDPDYQPTTLDLSGSLTHNGKVSKQDHSTIAVVPVRGVQGRVIFVFDLSRAAHAGGKSSAKSRTDRSAPRAASTPRPLALLLENGVRMPVTLGALPVSWYALDVDLHGSGRLDYASLCPIALIDDTMLLLAGPGKVTGYVSINGSATEVEVPSGLRPTIIDHKGITICVVNEAHLPEIYWTEKHVYVGVDGLDPDGHPIVGPSSKPLVLSPRGAVQQLALSGSPAHEQPSRSKAPARVHASRSAGRSAAPALEEWRAASAASFAGGESPRYASLAGPQPLSACGASSGYGWYRIELKAKSSRSRTCAIPFLADRAHLFLNGKRLGVLGFGPGASQRLLSLKFQSGRNTLIALVDNLGRFADGTDMADIKGFFGHIYVVRPIRAGKPKKVTAKPAHPFDLRNYISMRTFGQLSDTQQIAWTFNHPKKNPVLVEVRGCPASGTFVLNDKPVAYHSGSTGSTWSRILLGEPARRSEGDRGSETRATALKRGRNILRFAPDPQQQKPLEQIAKATTLLDCIETISEDAAWSFARWEPPPATSFHPMTKATAGPIRGQPCWWRADFSISSLDSALWLSTAGLSKGQVYLNDHNVGRYFTAAADRKSVGPQRRLYLPTPWLTMDEPNELVIFDEHGFDPFQSRLVISATGDLD